MSIEKLSFTKDVDYNAARFAFRARIGALAHAHERLAAANWISVAVRDLLDDALTSFVRRDRSNVELLGPRVEVNARCALSLGLAIHELATNAAKYGALSNATGHLLVTWSVTEQLMLEIDWVETVQAPLAEPTRKGFGRMLLEQGLSQELDGSVKMDFRRDGLRCLIRVPQEKYQIQLR